MMYIVKYVVFNKKKEKKERGFTIKSYNVGTYFSTSSIWLCGIQTRF